MAEIITIDLKVEHETEMAVMVTNLENKKVWLPKSQVEVDGDNREIQLPEWLAIDKELV